MIQRSHINQNEFCVSIFYFYFLFSCENLKDIRKREIFTSTPFVLGAHLLST